jgi:hypothetical protein
VWRGGTSMTLPVVEQQSVRGAGSLLFIIALGAAEVLKPRSHRILGRRREEEHTSRCRTDGCYARVLFTLHTHCCTELPSVRHVKFIRVPIRCCCTTRWEYNVMRCCWGARHRLRAPCCFTPTSGHQKIVSSSKSSL